jgi:hypothetical protein
MSSECPSEPRHAIRVLGTYRNSKGKGDLARTNVVSNRWRKPRSREQIGEGLHAFVLLHFHKTSRALSRPPVHRGEKIRVRESLQNNAPLYSDFLGRRRGWCRER